MLEAPMLKIVRAEAILTTGYVAGTVIDDTERYNQLEIFIKYTKGQLTSLQLKVEFSNDGETYYQETFESISGGTATATKGEHSFTVAGNQNFVLSIPIKASRIRISAQGTGTVTSSSLKLDAMLAVV